MAQNKTTQLSPKHWKALELIEEGTLSVKEIAKSIGWSQWTLYELMSGNTAKTGSIGELFYSELKKQHARNTSKVKHLFKDNQRLALIKLNERLRELRAQEPTEDVSAEICKIMNSLGKAGPSVEISNTSYSYTKGLTAEELVHEFKRLGTLARSTLDGGGVSCPKQGGPGTLPAPAKGRGKLAEE
jgi:hypothetical protein